MHRSKSLYGKIAIHGNVYAGQSELMAAYDRLYARDSMTHIVAAKPDAVIFMEYKHKIDTEPFAQLLSVDASTDNAFIGQVVYLTAMEDVDQLEDGMNMIEGNAYYQVRVFGKDMRDRGIISMPQYTYLEERYASKDDAHTNVYLDTPPSICMERCKQLASCPETNEYLTGIDTAFKSHLDEMHIVLSVKQDASYESLAKELHEKLTPRIESYYEDIMNRQDLVFDGEMWNKS
jgi:DUF971 family protein